MGHPENAASFTYAPTVRSYQYTEGTLALEFFDHSTQRAVWVGWGSKRLSNREDSEKLIDEAVKKILEAFPSAS